MSLTEQITALATRVGQEIKAVRAAKADDTAVVHNTGAETISGVKTFGSAPTVPTGAAAGNPVRRDDARLADARPPTDSSVTDAKVASNAAIAESKLALATDAAAGTGSRRTLGTGAQQAAAGSHGHSGYAATSHTHDYAASGHTHDSAYLGRAVPHVRIRKSGSDTSIPSATVQQVVMGTVDSARNNSGVLSTTTANAITVLQAGLYLMTADLLLRFGAAGYRDMIIRLNGNVFREVGIGLSEPVRFANTWTVPLALNDVVTLAAYHEVGNGVVIRSTNAWDTGLSLTRLGD